MVRGIRSRRSPVAAAVATAAAAACCSLAWPGAPDSRLAQVPAKSASDVITDEQRRKLEIAFAQVTAVINARQRTTAVQVIAILAIKCVLTNAMMARTRLMTQNYKRVANAGESWEEDKQMPAWAASVLKVLLLAFGPAPSEGMLPRLQGLLNNSMEIEPWFVGLTCIYCVRGVTGVQAVRFGSRLMWAFVIFRLVHAAAFVCKVRQPTRAFSYLAAAFSTVGLAVIALTGS